MLFFLIVHNSVGWIHLNLLQLSLHSLNSLQKFLSKEFPILTLLNECFNILEVLEWLWLIFREVVRHTVNPSSLLMEASQEIAPLTEELRPSLQIKQFLELEFVSPKIVTKSS